MQVLNPESVTLSLEALAKRLKPLGEVSYNKFMLRFKVDSQEIILFPDGRARISLLEVIRLW